MVSMGKQMETHYQLEVVEEDDAMPFFGTKGRKWLTVKHEGNVEEYEKLFINFPRIWMRR